MALTAAGVPTCVSRVLRFVRAEECFHKKIIYSLIFFIMQCLRTYFITQAVTTEEL